MADLKKMAIALNSNNIKALINEGHGVKGLSEMDLITLPQEFIQPIEERFNVDNTLEEYIPVIDISNWNDPNIENMVCDAAEEWGLIRLVNHGISTEVLSNLRNAAREFFELPATEKLKYTINNSPSKNVSLRTSFLPEIEKIHEWHDKLTFTYVSDEEALGLWPPICRKEVLEYIKSCEVLAKKLLKILLKRLNVKEIEETKHSMLMGTKRVNLNYYPKCPQPELAIGIGRHSDSSTITILPQGVIGGLWVRKSESDPWIHVAPINGALVINVGDALEIMSNGRYKSIEHFVTVSKNHNRISMPFFVGPTPCAIIRPFEEVLESTGEEPLYKECLYSEYAAHFYSKAHRGKDKIQFVLI